MPYSVVFTPEAEEHLVELYPYSVDGETVAVIGVFYGGRDFESLLGGDRE